MSAGAAPPARRSTLFLEVSSLAAEQARVDCLAVPVFGDERPLRGCASRADWRLCGALSRLVAAGRVTGRSGEAALLASFGGLVAPRVLVLGVGGRAGFGAGGIEAFAREAVWRASGLRAASLALALPEAAGAGLGLAERVEPLLVGAVEGLARRCESRPADLGLHVLVRPDELPRALELLRTSRPARLHAAVALRTVETVERRDPRGGRVLVPDRRTAESVK